MVKGVVAGMRTLFWAIVMLLLFVYTSAVLMRQTVGVDRVQLDDDYGTVLFSDMVWSMFMIFRILMQDLRCWRPLADADGREAISVVEGGTEQFPWGRFPPQSYQEHCAPRGQCDAVAARHVVGFESPIACTCVVLVRVMATKRISVVARGRWFRPPGATA